MAVVATAMLAFNPAVAEDPTTQTRDISGFDEVAVKGSGDVKITIGKGFKVEVTANAKDHEDIETTLRGGVLNISRERERGRRWNSDDGYFVTITMPKLAALDSRGSGDAIIYNLKADKFQVNQKGSGDVEISGSCKEGVFKSRGSGDLDARELTCEKAEITSKGSGDVELTVSGDVELRLKGSGDIDLYGSPRITSLKSQGSGEVTLEN
jgi:hypothetical protein